MDTNGPNTHFAYQPAYPYSLFQNQTATDPFRDTIPNQQDHVVKEPRSSLTKEQQLEIDRQIASRLQEIELARANTKDVPDTKTQESSSQYDQNDVAVVVSQQTLKNKHRQKKPTHVGFSQHHPPGQALHHR